MIINVESIPFDLEVVEDISDDMELLEELRKIDNGDYTVIVDVVERVYGAEQKARIYDYLRERYGRVRISTVNALLAETIDKSKDLKN